MGTSTGYNAPTTPQWQAVKSEVSREAPYGRPGRPVAQKIVSDFIHAGGGAHTIVRGQGSIGRNQSAQRIAAGFGGFITSVAERGLPAALEQAGLGELVGQPIGLILNALVDTLGGPADTLDDVDGRNALSRLWDELLGQAESADDVERILTSSAGDHALVDLLTRFYAFYLYEQFCRVFYERLVARVGDATADSFLGGILDFLGSSLREHHITRDIRRIHWGGPEGRALADELLEQTLLVFGGY